MTLCLRLKSYLCVPAFAVCICLQVPACTTTRCSFTATYPQPPGAGEYKAATTVQYQQPHSTHVAVATVETAFKVGL